MVSWYHVSISIFAAGDYNSVLFLVFLHNVLRHKSWIPCHHRPTPTQVLSSSLKWIKCSESGIVLKEKGCLLCSLDMWYNDLELSAKSGLTVTQIIFWPMLKELSKLPCRVLNLSALGQDKGYTFWGVLSSWRQRVIFYCRYQDVS